MINYFVSYEKFNSEDYIENNSGYFQLIMGKNKVNYINIPKYFQYCFSNCLF